MKITQAATDVLAERQGQKDREGWTEKHDDEHASGSLAVAAACYALSGAGWAKEAVLELWPKAWSVVWLKPKSQRQDLVRAAALLLAEIERLDRMKAPNSKVSGASHDDQ